MENKTKSLTQEQSKDLLATLRTRFEKNMSRHGGIEWAKVQTRLEAQPEKLWSLQQMEQSGGEPDLVAADEKTGEFVFYDCSAETPEGRRNVCYDRKAQESRKKFAPEHNAMDLATEMGTELLSEEEYRELQKLGEFDLKTSSWVRTPAEVRKLNGALFADRRFGRVFVYHNGADSYYGARGFRTSLRV
ncbi:MAG TPA: DUF4256 domain-containing protein [Anaerolineaceae bacterium]|nr:DUF4256 domain-containing protein [Anaerolineaceae bacterium]